MATIETFTGGDLLKVTIKSFNIFGSPTRKTTVVFYGQISRSGVICYFEMRAGGNRPTRLEFKNATIFDGSDPTETAIAVKRCLLEYMRSSDDVPASMRDYLLEAILKHHERVR